MKIPCFWTGSKLGKLQKQVNDLESKVCELQKQWAEIQQRCCHSTVIENLYVGRVNVDRLEFANNFGAMAIRELGGTLNIGVNCAGSRLPGAGKIITPDEKREINKPFPGKPPPAGRKAAGPDRNQSDLKDGSLRSSPDVSKKSPGGRRAGPVCNVRYGP
ncbi:MAG: hypothetical protein AB1523_06655 [Bacillota bacterium]